MKPISIIALSFLALVSATPLAKRALVTETTTEEVTMTLDTTTTIWVPPTTSTASPHENYQQPAPKHGQSHQHLHSHYTAPAVTTPRPAQQPAPVQPVQQAPKAVAPAPVPKAPEVHAAPVASVYHPGPTRAPASQPTSQLAPQPAPQTVSQPAPVAPAPSPSQGSSSSSSGGACGTIGGKCSGDITYYQAGLGACGWTNDGSTEDVFALAHGMMGDQSNGNSFCGRMATIKVPGKPAVTAKLVDKCMGCEGQSIDLSNHLFDQLCDETTGRLHNVEWSFTS